VKLRSHLVTLVLVAVLPVLAFTAVMGAVYWRQQRDAYDERFLERVRALATALDRELDGHVRALQVLGQSTALLNGDIKSFYDRAARVRAEQRAWDGVVLLDPNGQQLANTRRPFGTPLPRTAVPDAILTQVATSGRPAVTPLLRGAVIGRYTTAVIVPVRLHGDVRYLLLCSIEPTWWLDLLAPYPIVRGATMTLVDQNGIIIARTLNHERWVGKPPSSALLAQIAKSPESAYRNNVGLEGQRFYSAHSRVPISGWSLATGVPSETVDSALRGPAIALAAGAIVMVALALGLAVVVGQRIARPVAALARSVVSFGGGGATEPLHSPAVDEVREVAQAFEEAAARLRARETTLREAREEAETANRMKDEFLAVLSHELRTPINAVYGWARILRTSPGGTSLPHGLEVIERNAAAQVQLIEDLLDVSRIVRGKMQLDVRSVDVAAAVAGAMESMRHAADVKGIHLERQLADGVGPIVGDPDRLRQVVWNLLSNAIKFTPSGGRVTVKLARVNAHVEIVVTDTGSGIEPDLLPHIFERFRQGDSTSTRRHGGLGLGLALVKHIVELHGGTVRAEAGANGAGTTFTVTLPVVAIPAPAPPAQRDAERPPPKLDGVRVLFVDDDADTLDLFARIMLEHGAEVRTAISAEDAMQIFAAWTPDVFVSDVEMPGEDGYALIQRVRAISDVPAVAVTAYNRTEDRLRVMAAGYNMHVPKPVEPDELVLVVTTLLRRAGRP